MNITDELNLSEEDLEENCEALMKAEKIKSSPAIYKATIKYMKETASRMNSIADLRAKLATMENEKPQVKLNQSDDIED